MEEHELQVSELAATHSGGEHAMAQLQNWRHALIRRILRVLVILGALAVAAGAYVDISQGTWWTTPIYIGAYGVLLALTFWEQSPYALQVGILLLIFYGVGTLSISQSGLSGDTGIFFLTCTALAVLFFSWRGGLAMLGLCVLTLVASGAAFGTGVFHVTPEALYAISADWVSWVSTGVVFLMLGTLLVLSQHYLFQQLIDALGLSRRLTQELDAQRGNLESEVQARTQELQQAYDEMEQRVEERTAALQHEIAERERLQQEIIGAQQQAILELSSPVIPVMDRILVMPLVGSIDTMRARDIMRMLLQGISDHRAQIVILDVTGVPIMDTGIVNHINKTIQAARLKGAHAIVTGISDAVAEAVVDLGIDWSDVQTLRDLQTGLRVALERMGTALQQKGTN
jgi:anti-anti-sigma regulatory factor